VTENNQSLEKPIKSVDRDFAEKGFARYFWGLSYTLAVLGAFALFARFWDEIHLHGLQFHSLVRIVGLPLICVCPLILSLSARRYIRSALKENLVSERVAGNFEYWIGIQLTIAYMAIMQFVMWG
jgi:hypothetical protein